MGNGVGSDTIRELLTKLANPLVTAGPSRMGSETTRRPRSTVVCAVWSYVDESRKGLASELSEPKADAASG